MESRKDKLEVLKTAVQQCMKCSSLVFSRKLYPYGKPTFGYGNANTTVVFVGMCPGMYGCGTYGIPFYGDASGKLFQDMLHFIGLTKEDVWVTNTVKCCPENNREPTLDEINSCSSFLRSELSILQPKLIVPLGLTAIKMFMPLMNTVWEVNAKPIKVSNITYGVATVFPLYHPAAICRNMAKLDNYKQDWLKLKACIFAVPEEYKNLEDNKYGGD